MHNLFIFLWNALHVSGSSSAHHQELKTVYTALGTLSNLYCYLPLSWESSNSSMTVAGSSKGLTKYPMLYIQFWAPDDGQRNRLKYVEHFTKNSDTLYLVGRTWKYVCDARTHERQIWIPEFILRALDDTPTHPPSYNFGYFSQNYMWIVFIS